MQKTLDLGPVTLAVKNLDELSNFYTSFVGLDILENGSKDETLLGKNGKEVLRLKTSNKFVNAKKNSAGLYHTAIVFGSRHELAKSIVRILDANRELYQGSADHIATEAFYFADPEGNGVELYFDKPESEMQFDSEGKPIIGSVYLDTLMYITKYLELEDNNKEIKVGHVHLKVGDIDTAEKFYIGALNFGLMLKMPTALFLSRDNYHHHLGMNTWESLGAMPRQDNELGLISFEIQVKIKQEFENIISNIKKDFSDNILTNSSSELSIKDPWGTSLL